ncbi:hypothetical protein AAY473_005732 [Plecturocebus cupreus]
MGFLHVGQAVLEFLTSGDPPTLASQSAGINRHEPSCLATDISFQMDKTSSDRVSLLSPRLDGVQWRDLGSLQSTSASRLPASQVAGITGAHHHTWLIFVFLVETEFHHVGQAGLQLLTSGHPPASASQNSVTSYHHHPWLMYA